MHAEFLWGPASLGMALLIGRGFTNRGWDMELGDEREIGELPAYTFTRDGERELQPCGERFLTEKDIQRLIDAGTGGDRKPPRSERRRRHPVSVDIGSAGAARLVTFPN